MSSCRPSCKPEMQSDSARDFCTRAPVLSKYWTHAKYLCGTHRLGWFVSLRMQRIGGSGGTAGACGGDVVGTWQVSSSCVTVDTSSMMDSDLSRHNEERF